MKRKGFLVGRERFALQVIFMTEFEHGDLDLIESRKLHYPEKRLTY